ncbi:stage II sporulation protein M [Brevibacillus choshinensis]|uniref:stage II sporulation protein M n=1 Tax=Brevibacillus choshinensis TaxID=54911 RepID=UPI002E244143|nr:stage II sporulation protein M [Brevibacillus choshinensis]MED4754502.1 stage II sporulation protein M [Brevibacillus choshinensis]MED4782882.1 stage II sporulation protein M [Brevibacillus choshinensis]
MKNHLRRLWLDNRRFFLAACLLFIGGGLIGYLQAPMVESMVSELMGQLKEIVDRIKESGGGVFATFWMIFSNNVVSALMMMALGLFFAFFPIIGLVANGILLGFILSKSVGVSPWLMFGAGILPHGIFELPAVLFAAGIGIRLGLLSFRSVGVLFQPNKVDRLKNDWYDTLKQFPVAVITVIVLLLIAAIVESSITPFIINGLIGDQMKINVMK